MEKKGATKRVARALSFPSSERRRRALELRFGLVDGRIKTQKEIAGEFQVSERRVRQLIHDGIKELSSIVEKLKD